MSTNFFKAKKSIKRFIKKHTPEQLYIIILPWYRFLVSCYLLFLSYIPGSCYYDHRKIKEKFKERHFINIKGTDIKIMIDPKNGPLDLGLFKYRHRDDIIITRMKEFLKDGDTMVDLGANIGYETLFGSKFVGNHGKVYSFEPRPNLVSQIRESLKENQMNNVIIYQKAVGDQKKIVKLYIHSDEPGNASIVDSLNASFIMETEIVILDEELKGISPKFIKIDIEGYEFEALKGALDIIKKCHPIIVFEFSAHLYEKDYRGKSLELLNFLSNNGYSIAVIEEIENLIKKEDFEKFIDKILFNQTIFNLIAKPF